MSEIASAYIAILPSMKGFASKVVSGGGAEASAAGSLLGGTFGKAFAKLAGPAAIAGIGTVLYSAGPDDNLPAAFGEAGA